MAERLRAPHGVYIDGVNHLTHWTSSAPSQRNFVYYDSESELNAFRIGPSKSHLNARNFLFDHLQPSSNIFNLRMDPFKRHGGRNADEMTMQQGVAWGGQVYDAIGAHIAKLEHDPPRKASDTLTTKSK